MLLLGLSTVHKVGLALAAGVFAGFSLVVAMLVPRWRPQFPGRGLPLFLVVSVLLFLGMLAAVEIFGAESESEAAEAGGGGGAAAIKVSEVEWAIRLPKTTFSPGSYTFDVRNEGKVPHNLTVQGPGGKEATPDFGPGGSKTLRVQLKPGSYDFYCSVPGHKQLGMDVKVTVS